MAAGWYAVSNIEPFEALKLLHSFRSLFKSVSMQDWHTRIGRNRYGSATVTCLEHAPLEPVSATFERSPVFGHVLGVIN